MPYAVDHEPSPKNGHKHEAIQEAELKPGLNSDRTKAFRSASDLKHPRSEVNRESGLSLSGIRGSALTLGTKIEAELSARGFAHVNVKRVPSSFMLNIFSLLSCNPDTVSGLTLGLDPGSTPCFGFGPDSLFCFTSRLQLRYRYRLQSRFARSRDKCSYQNKM
ncbi:hypothetical protein EVAR_76592_1 [Eumeta japonica]|uniref:Uncharacterized protein n=1 Tax=Eumeta variegata TaxID=151549 RepID=A0A4C1T5Y9_EUMVA|nr:hypothetical protein EVAR_76592_1 [Eumeta japonica]